MSSTPEFQGQIARTVRESTPWWPESTLPSAGSPNVLVVLLDDTGFSHLGCFGGEIDTPNMDRLAEHGIRYANFHTTALCSPTRAALLTGRNHHSVGMQALSNFDTGFPNMRGQIAPSAGTMAEVLGSEGYSTFCVGKWHLAPMREASAAGPYTNWPLGKGFDRFYGFMQGETDQFHPELYSDNHLVDPPAVDNYHLSEDLVDKAMAMIGNQHSLVPERPWFCYLPFGATHAPHQAPDDYLTKYRGRFDDGWDVCRQRVYERQLELGIIPPGTELAPRNPGVEAWDDLGADQQAFAARLQEAFAAFLDHTDAQIGRLLDELERLGVADNTMVILTSDNGASQEGNATGVMDEFRYFNNMAEDLPAAYERLDDIGTRRSFTNYPWGWAQVGNCPGKRYKQNTHGGGVRDPLIISWPDGIDGASSGSVRHQFHHVIDLAPTVFEAVGVVPPRSVKGVVQQPIEGQSMSYTFGSDAAETPTTKTSQYFEMRGHRAIWAGGWKGVTYHAADTSLEDDTWELYHLDSDFSECHDLATDQPEKMAEMIELFWADAERFGVLPIDERGRFGSAFAGRPIPGTPRARDSFVYYPPVARIPSDSAPAMGSRSWKFRAEVNCESATAGVILAYGTVNNGLSIYVEQGPDGSHLVYEHNFFQDRTFIRSPQPIPAGSVVLGVELDRVRRGPAEVRLLLDDKVIATGIVPELSIMISSVGLDIGRGLAGVSDALAPPADFEGTINRISIDTVRAFSAEDERSAEIRVASGTQ